MGYATTWYLKFAPPWAGVQFSRRKVYPFFRPPARSREISWSSERSLMAQVNPAALWLAEYPTSAVFNKRMLATAEDSFAAIRARSKFGIAMAAIIRMTGMVAMPT